MMIIKNNEFIKTALEYLAMNWSVIPIKGPAYAQGYTDEERAQESYKECIIKGEPNLHMKLLITREIPPRTAAAAQLVNRIPDVINSEPGFVTVEKLPKLKFRAFPMDHYITG